MKKFDFIIGNPPYQEGVGGGNGKNAVPLYQDFIRSAKQLNPIGFEMITPSKWFNGGRNLDDFRDEMLNDRHIKAIHDYRNSKECFDNIELQGGVSILCWEKEYDSPNCYFYEHEKGKSSVLLRPLKNDYSNGIIRYNNAITIIDKVCKLTDSSFSKMVSSQTPFGLYSNFQDFTPIRDNNVELIKRRLKTDPPNVYVKREYITKNVDLIDKYKVYFTLNYGAGMTGGAPFQVMAKPFMGYPNSVCTQSYLVVSGFNTEYETRAVVAYMKTKFFRFLTMMCIAGQTFSPNTFTIVPIQDFTPNSDITWSVSIHEIDLQMYKKYGLSEEEILFVENYIKEMD